MKRILSLLMSTILLTLTSCSLILHLTSRTELINEIDKSDKEIAESKLLKILDALENKDSEALKNMLSEEALNEAEDLDEDIQNVLDYYKGAHIEYKGDTPTSSGSYNAGKRTEYHVSSTFEVTTEVDSYYIAFYYQVINDKCPEKIGLRCIQIVKNAEKQPWNSALGIYVLTEKLREQKN